MGKLENSYSKFALNKVIADGLIEDGVIGNANTKDYDEQATLEGGTGNRLAFNKYNNRIKNYHTALKVLAGEQRANVYESIPVIDYLNPENTSLLYTYHQDDLGKVDTTTIYPAEGSSLSPLELLENEDNFTINRALMGEPIAEHFYNTIGSPSEYNVQVSPWMGEDAVEYYYRGIENPKIYINGLEAAPSQRKVGVYSIQVPEPARIEGLEGASIVTTESMWINFGMDASLPDEELGRGTNPTYRFFDTNGIPVICPDPNDSTYLNNFIVDNINFVTKTENRYGELERYLIELDSGDVCVAIPRSTYSDDAGFSRLFIFKKVTNRSSESKQQLTWSEILALTSVDVGDAYYLINDDASAPSTFVKDTLLRCKQAISSTAIDPADAEEYWEIMPAVFEAFTVFASAYTSSYTLTEVSADTQIPEYLTNSYIFNILKKYISLEKIYIAKASGLLNGCFCEPLERDNFPISSDSLPSTGSKVTKWKFLDETEEASKNGIAINVGSKYYPGHLLDRGDFSAEPLRLTASDPRYRKIVNGVATDFYSQAQYEALADKSNVYPYKGKASVIYDKLNASTEVFFNNVKVNNWSSFNLHSIDNYITKADYSTDVAFSTSEAKDLLGITTSVPYYNKSSRLNYPEKFKKSDGTVLSKDEILKYFVDVVNCIDPDDPTVLKIDLTSEGPWAYTKIERTSCTEQETISGTSCGNTTYSTVEVSKERITLSGEGSTNLLATNLNKTFYVRYSRDYEEPTSDQLQAGNVVGTPKGDIYGISVRVFSPLEAFSLKEDSKEEERYYYNPETDTAERGTWVKPKGTTLIYPEYTKYYSEDLILLSKDDLGLEEYSDEVSGRRSMVSFMTDKGEVLCYKVSSVMSFKPSEIKTVRLRTSEQEVFVNYPYGLYPSLEPHTVSYVSDFATVRSDSTTVIKYNGMTFSVEDLKKGKYSLYRGITTDEVTGIWKITSAANIGMKVDASKDYDYLRATEDSSSTAPEASSSKAKKVAVDKTKSYASKKTTKVTSKPNLPVLHDRILDITAEVEEAEEDIPSSNKYSAVASNTQIKANTVVIPPTVEIPEDPEPVYDFTNYSISVSGIASEMDVLYNKIREKYKSLSYSGEYYNIPIYSTRTIYTSKAETAFDCYIYTLEPMQLSLSSLSLYDQEDNLINTLDDLSKANIVPMSYPSNFFACYTIPQSDGRPSYILKDRSQVAKLKGSYILPGLPNFTSEKDLRNKGKWGLDLNPLANLIFKSDSSTNKAASSILNKSISYILRNFKLSNLRSNKNYSKNYNPLLLKDFPSLVSGIIEIQPLINKLYTAAQRSAFTISVGGSTVTVQPEDLIGLIKRISMEDSYAPATYSISIDESQWDDNYSSFISELSTRLESISITVTSPPKEDKRPSLMTVKEVVEDAVGAGGSPTSQTCEALDRYFGNSTPPILTTGYKMTFEDEFGVPASFNITSALSEAGTDLREKVGDIILQLAKNSRSNYLENLTYPGSSTTFLGTLQNIYKKYYTAATVNSVVTSLDYSLFNEDPNLTVDYSSEEVISFLRKVKSQSVLFRPFWGFKWSIMSFERWLRIFQAMNSTDEQYIYITSTLRTLIQEVTSEEAASIMSLSTAYPMPSISQVDLYLNALNNSSSSSPKNFFWTPKTISDNTVSAALTVILPNYDRETNTFTPSINLSTEELTAGTYYRKNVTFPASALPDLSPITLKAIAGFAKTVLEGTGDSNYYVKYVEGDSGVSGRENSLYYKRYQMLNNRMNTVNGTLAKVITLIRNRDILDTSSKYNEDLVESYSKFLDVTPIVKMEPLSYMPEQKASATTIELPGKFYYEAELEALRSLISPQCVLTCTKCTVAKSCPFYNEEELIKLYCTPAETIDFYVKDNELDLIDYSTERTTNSNNETVVTTYPNVNYTSLDTGEEESLSPQRLQKMHLRYNDILRKVSGGDVTLFSGRDLQEIKEELRASSDVNNFNMTTDGSVMGYLLGGRYGTVEKNLTAMIANQDEDFQEFSGKEIPEYKYLYNAVYIADEETEVNYSTSPDLYDVSFSMGPQKNKKTFKGKTRIKIPSSLKILARSKPEDDVYLVSDDLTDDAGTRILPVIYLGQVANLQWSFGIELDPEKSVQSSDDKTIYASDIAQWCINYYKGTCADDPVGDIGEDLAAPIKDADEDKDQYWMEEIKKKIRVSSDSESSEYKYITVEGRPREYTGYQEPLADPDNFDELAAAAGRPVAASFINFIRKFSIRIYDPSKPQFDDSGNYIGSWTIPWVKDAGEKTLSDGTVINIETQRSALAYMKTNLRLVVIKNLHNN